MVGFVNNMQGTEENGIHVYEWNVFIQQEMNRKHTASGRNIARLMRQREVKVGIMCIVTESVGNLYCDLYIIPVIRTH
jgi:hypothetical protein